MAIRLSWLADSVKLLLPLLFAFSASAQSITPTNSTPFSYNGIPIDWAAQKGPPGNPAEAQGGVLPLKDKAASIPGDGLAGTAIIPKTSNDSQLVISSNIVFVQCDPSIPEASVILQTAIVRNPVAVVLFSNTSNYCSYTSGNFINSDYDPLYTMTSSDGYSKLYQVLNSVGDYPMSILLARQNAFANSSSNGNGQASQGSQNTGPSPSTAVAMIILYSITGVITALFLVIIITGAVRAHRHPERYGPRNVLGAPRQSRARGLGRAILDTIPIVKFGEKEEPKPGDVEMAPTSSDAAPPATRGDADTIENATTSVADAEHGNASSDAARNANATSSATPDPEVPEENQGCSICTDDFERGQDVRVLPCNHSFHPACIDPWLLNVSGTCPLCRIDLRPIASRTSDFFDPAEYGAGNRRASFAPPLDTDLGADDTPAGGPSANRASRRFSVFWEALNPRRMQDASPQERIAALRTLREQRRQTSADEEMETRRRRRLTMRLYDTFHIRTRGRSGDRRQAGSATPESDQPAPGQADSTAQSRRPSPARSVERDHNAAHQDDAEDETHARHVAE